MVNHSSATVRETPHPNQTSRTNTIDDALRQRAEAVLNDRSIDPQSRAIIRYALEINDPWLAKLVRRASAGESVAEAIESRTIESEGDANEDQIEALAEIIARASDKSAAALFLLMGIIEDSTQPDVLANVARQAAFNVLTQV